MDCQQPQPPHGSLRPIPNLWKMRCEVKIGTVASLRVSNHNLREGITRGLIGFRLFLPARSCSVLGGSAATARWRRAIRALSRVRGSGGTPTTVRA